jgi:hypothetical protein
MDELTEYNYSLLKLNFVLNKLTQILCTVYLSKVFRSLTRLTLVCLILVISTLNHLEIMTIY